VRRPAGSEAEQKLREIQEVLAEAEYDAGHYYHEKGSNAAAANRFETLIEEYPLYSRADLALWEQADAYSRMGPRFRQKEGDALAKIVRDYPLSPLAEQARRKLQSLELPVPEADPKAVARMKYDKENYHRPSLFHRTTAFIAGRPDVSHAAKTGQPTMENPKPTIPASVPVQAQAAGVNEVTVAPVTDPTALDKLPDARANPPAASAPATGGKETPSAPAAGGKETPAASSSSAAPAAASPAPEAKDSTSDSKSKKKKKKNDKKSTTSTSQPEK